MKTSLMGGSNFAVRIIIIFLALTYAIGAPFTMFLEYRDQLLSQRFEYSSLFIYSICIIQFLCAIGIIIRPFTRWSAIILTVITLGAIYSHLQIESPATAIPALLYTVLQVWVIVKSK